MKYVYILESLGEPDRHYVGITDDLRTRLKSHNAWQVYHTSKFKPWRVNTYIAFSDHDRAVLFERYLKTQSGRAFSKKRL
jgi:predicted GIY-YIG superfamily endonuclease